MESLFHPAVAAWFKKSFAAPTPAQAKAWPAIRSGRDVLIAAPTGSGKTLAAFLAAINALVEQGLAGELKDQTQVVYVSPLKALSNDVQRNLEAPLQGIFGGPARNGLARNRKSAPGFARAILRLPSAKRCGAGLRISSSQHRNRFTSCWVPIRGGPCWRPPER